MKIIEDKQNPLLKRKEVKAIIGAEKNPTMQEAAKIVAKHFKVEEECIAVKSIKGKFGRNTFLMVTNVYNSKEDKDKTESAVKKKGKKGEEKNPEEQKPAEQTEQKQPETKQKPGGKE